MRAVFDAFWRAALYCLHPRVIVLSLVPLLLLVVMCLGLAYWGWDWAIDAVNAYLNSPGVLSSILNWLSFITTGGLRAVVAPLVVLALTLPVMVMVCLLAVSVLMTPAVVRLVAQRRFANLHERKGAALWRQVLWSLGSTAVALLVLLVTLPLWLIPPFALLLPPLIWGWLTYRVLAFDALAAHATPDERKQVFQAHRSRLFMMGVFTGIMGAAPGVIGASGALSVVLAPILLPLAIWIYTLVFAFASAWFAHFCLDALTKLRAEAALKTGAHKVPEPITYAPVELLAPLP
jgi:hypothetical protein